MQEAAEVATLVDDEAAAPATVDEPWAVYLLLCNGGKCYIGISPRPQERFEAHRVGRGGAFTRAHPPQSLAAVVWFENRSAAASMEPRLKALKRAAKLEWFRRFAGTTASRTATLEDGMASLAGVTQPAASGCKLSTVSAASGRYE